jgi:hypothetical protein
MVKTVAEEFAHRTDLIDLASFSSHKAAELFCQQLHSQGIETQVFDERDLQLFVFMTAPKAYMKIQVQEEKYAEAAALLIEFEKNHPEYARYLYSCPECGSFAIEYPQYTRKFITPLLVEWLSIFGLFPKQCYCRKCHYTWSRKRRGGINKQHLNPPPSVFVPPAG